MYSQIFRGPMNNHDTVTSLFPQPIEARHLRINPHTWTNEIALNLDILGCKATPTVFTETTTVIPSTARGPMCTDAMGIEAGLLAPSQISVSSSQVNVK